jgi:hypothetical protein
LWVFKNISELIISFLAHKCFIASLKVIDTRHSPETHYNPWTKKADP